MALWSQRAEGDFFMIEPIMFIWIGFLVAGLLVIGVIPLVHARAVRLTLKRIEAVTPMSMAEIQADKDQLRAEFAMSTRRLEMSVEQMKAKTATHLAEIGKKSEAVGRLKLELGEKTAALFELETREQQLVEALATAEQELAGRGTNLREIERLLADARSETAIVTANHDQATAAAESRRVELMALRAQVEVFKGQIASFEKETQELNLQVQSKKAAVESTYAQLIEERGKGETAANRIIELERKLMLQNTETELLNHRVQELITRREELDRDLVERDSVTIGLRAKVEEVQKTEADLRAALAELEDRRRVTTDTLRAEKVIVESLLRQAQEEKSTLLAGIDKLKREADGVRAKVEELLKTEANLGSELAQLEDRRRVTTDTLRTEKGITENLLRLAQEEKSSLLREIEKLKREAETAWVKERAENALLRDRISEVAAEIASLTVMLEGPNSPIHAILAGDPTRVNAGLNANGHGAQAADNGKGSLADRIRALQNRAPRPAPRPAARA